MSAMGEKRTSSRVSEAVETAPQQLTETRSGIRIAPSKAAVQSDRTNRTLSGCAVTRECLLWVVSGHSPELLKKAK